MMDGLGSGNVEPRLCIGDLNCNLKFDDKIGGNPPSQRDIAGFQWVVQNCGLRDLHVEGFPYTWTNNREDGENIQERLDRTLVYDS